MISIFSSPRYKVNKKVLATEVDRLIVENHIDPALQINIVFVGRRKMKALARTYKNEDVALPVLSFPDILDPDIPKGTFPGEKLLGDIIICFPQAVLLAAEKNKGVDMMLLQLIDHGLENLLKG